MASPPLSHTINAAPRPVSYASRAVRAALRLLWSFSRLFLGFVVRLLLSKGSIGLCHAQTIEDRKNVAEKGYGVSR